jgi:pyridoxal phosphate enzyme (YggS family)
LLDSAVQARLRDRLARVEERIVAACARSGRLRADVTLVAVTKTVGTELVRGLTELGVLDLGENRPQELWRKAPALPAAIRWHMIGHLQRNKIDKTLPLAHVIHAVDSLRLLEAVEAEAAKLGRSVSVLLEVNASGESSKHGFEPAEVTQVVSALTPLRHVEVQGLMTMAALQEPEACRPTFAVLRQMRDLMKAEVPAMHPMKHLSMGMSNDFEVAIEEGATFVRLGTVLFEGVA